MVVEETQQQGPGPHCTPLGTVHLEFHLNGALELCLPAPCSLCGLSRDRTPSSLVGEILPGGGLRTTGLQPAGDPVCHSQLHPRTSSLLCQLFSAGSSRPTYYPCQPCPIARDLWSLASSWVCSVSIRELGRGVLNPYAVPARPEV